MHHCMRKEPCATCAISELVCAFGFFSSFFLVLREITKRTSESSKLLSLDYEIFTVYLHCTFI